MNQENTIYKVESAIDLMNFLSITCTVENKEETDLDEELSKEISTLIR